MAAMPAIPVKRSVVPAALGLSMALAGCQAMPPETGAGEPAEASFRALGQEPPWLVLVEGRELEFVTEYGQSRRVLPLLAAREAGAERRFEAADAAGSLVVSATPELCHDIMSGMPHPYTVAVTVLPDGATLQGCGGEPLELLVGRTWVIEDLDGAGIIDRSRITLEFLPEESRIAGRASCNAYNAAYSLSGEGLSFGHAAVTKMACAPALMDQEQQFLRILAAVDRFDFDDAGALLLLGREGRLRGFPEHSR